MSSPVYRAVELLFVQIGKKTLSTRSVTALLTVFLLESVSAAIICMDIDCGSVGGRNQTLRLLGKRCGDNSVFRKIRQKVFAFY